LRITHFTLNLSMFSRTVNEKYSPYTDSRQTHTQVTESSGQCGASNRLF